MSDLNLGHSSRRIDDGGRRGLRPVADIAGADFLCRSDGGDNGRRPTNSLSACFCRLVRFGWLHGNGFLWRHVSAASSVELGLLVTSIGRSGLVVYDAHASFRFRLGPRSVGNLVDVGAKAYFDASIVDHLHRHFFGAFQHRRSAPPGTSQRRAGTRGRHAMCRSSLWPHAGFAAFIR